MYEDIIIILLFLLTRCLCDCSFVSCLCARVYEYTRVHTHTHTYIYIDYIVVMPYPTTFSSIILYVMSVTRRNALCKHIIYVYTGDIKKTGVSRSPCEVTAGYTLIIIILCATTLPTILFSTETISARLLARDCDSY